MGGPEMAPHTPPSLGAPRRSRGTPRYADRLLLARGVRRELLDVARDGADVFLADQALPRCHAGAGPPGLDDSNEVRLAALERLGIRSGRGSLGVGAMPFRALPDEPRPRGPN